MKAAAWRVGLLALAGLAVLVATVIGLGGQWFVASERALMRFDSSVYGLQVGAPVVLRGVRVGQVTAIRLAPAGPQGLMMPVTAEFDQALLRGLLGETSPPAGPALPVLVRQGLVARLATQSLLTGLLYVDLDLAPARAAALAGRAASAASEGGLPLIPTEPTRLQTLQAQLENLDLAQIGQDLAAVAASARQLMAEPGSRQALARTAQAAQAVQSLVQRLEREVGPLARAAEATLAESRSAVRQIAPAAQQVGSAAAQIGAAASHVAAAANQLQALASAGTPMVGSLQRSADELARTAAVLREAAGEDSALRLDGARALQDVSRAARSLRELGDLLERHPDALLRGRAGPP